MSDLTHIYCFGPSADRKSAAVRLGARAFRRRRARDRLGDYYDDGTNASARTCGRPAVAHGELQLPEHELQAVLRRRPPGELGAAGDPRPVVRRSPDDGYAMVPIELDWTARTGASPTTTAHRREDHPLPGDPLPARAPSATSSSGRWPDHDLHERHQAREPTASTRPTTAARAWTCSSTRWSFRRRSGP